MGARIMRVTVTVDCSTSTITPAAEREIETAVSAAADGDMVNCWPPSATGGGSLDLLWVSYACSSCVSGSTGIVLRISNTHASVTYSANTNWYCTVTKFQ